MTEKEKRIQIAFEILRKKTPPNMLTDLHYGFFHQDDKPDLVDYNTLVGFIDTASQFSIDILREGEKALKCKIILSLYDTIDSLEDCIEKLK